MTVQMREGGTDRLSLAPGGRAGAVDWERLRLHAPAADEVAAMALEGPGPGLADAWTADAAAAQLAAARACEQAGYEFAALSPRTAALLGWLGHRLPAVAHARVPAIDRCALGLGAAGATAPEPVRAIRLPGGGWRLAGELPLVEDVGAVEGIILDAVAGDGRGLFLLPLSSPGVHRLACRPLDAARPAFALEIGGEGPTSAERLDRSGPDRSESAAALVDGVTALARLLVAAEMLGIARLMLDLAVRHARGRRQFGQPIGAFQAVAHACADMLCDIELTRSLVHAQAGRLTPDAPSARAEAGKVKLLAALLCPGVADRALHLFGAEGLTWERGLHFAVRRMQSLRVLWGDALQCEDEAAALLGEAG